MKITNNDNSYSYGFILIPKGKYALLLPMSFGLLIILDWIRIDLNSHSVSDTLMSAVIDDSFIWLLYSMICLIIIESKSKSIKGK